MGRRIRHHQHRLSQRTIGFLVTGIGLTGILIASLITVQPGRNTAITADASQIADGRSLYVTYCASCHGLNLEGQPNWKRPLPNGMMPAPPHDATGHTWHHPDSLLFQITKYGGQSIASPGYVSGMPAFGNQLTDRQIWAILAYIKSTWPPEIREAQEAVNRRSP